MTVFVFVDTNLLLQYQLFDEVDWPKELGIPQLTLVFAPVVFDEVLAERVGFEPDRTLWIL